MAHIFKMEEWQSNDKWICGDISALAKNSNMWWYIPSLLDISPVEYIKLLKEKFNATGFYYRLKSDVLLFHFNSLQECRKFKNYINKIAREKNFVIY